MYESMPETIVQPRRTLLFVPAVRPDRFPKAMAAGADIVCLDLEDAVAPADKDKARAQAQPFFAEPGPPGIERALRINSVRTPTGLKDLLAVIEAETPPDNVMLPMVGSGEEVKWVDELLAQAARPIGLYVLVETNDGLANVHDIAAASPRLKLLLFGGGDLSTELGSTMAFEPLMVARAQVLHAARRFGVDALDVPFLDIPNLDGLREECLRVRDMGYTGKALIYPTHVPVANAVFTPSAEEIAYAKKVIVAFDAASNGLAIVDGRLIEIPIVMGLKRRLAIAEAVGAA